MQKYFALRITNETLPLIEVLNGGVRPDQEAMGAIYMYPLDPEGHADIVTYRSFLDNHPNNTTLFGYLSK